MSIGSEHETETRPTPTSRTSPYQGLVPFGEEDAEWFFGRDESREIVIDNLRAYRISVLYGESGVGKSSLLRAAVLPQLRREARDNLAARETAELIVAFADWSAADPLRTLKAAILEAADEPTPSPGDAAADPTLADLLSRRSMQPGAATVLIFDQFEELFLYHGADQRGRVFEDELADAMRDPAAPANFLISIREDALAKLDRLQGQVRGLLDNLVRIEHLDEPAARNAIERPLEHWNSVKPTEVEIETLLVDQILSELHAGSVLLSGFVGVGHRDGPADSDRVEAPYLQLVLERIWNEEHATASSVMRLQTLERLGGSERIVRTHLDEVLNKLSRKERRIAAGALRYLVTPSGTKIALQEADLAAYTGTPAQRLHPVLNKLSGEARILRPVRDGAYEIYHDVLAAAVLDWRQRYVDRQRNSLAARSVLLTIAAAAVAIMIVAYQGNVLAGWEAGTLDARFAIRGKQRPPSNVIVVGIDNRTLASAGTGEFPFPRAFYGRLIDRLVADHASAIAIDIDLADRTTVGATCKGFPCDDIALLDSISNHPGRTVFVSSAIASNGGGQVRFLGSDQGTKLLASVGSRAATNLYPAGTIRRMDYSIDGLQTLAAATVAVATRHRLLSSQFPGSSTMIDYVGPQGTISEVPFSAVFENRVEPSDFRNKIVVVGATAPSLGDIHSTSVGSMSGPEIQANSIETIVRGFPLRTRTGVDIALIVLLGVLAPLVAIWLDSVAVFLIAVAVGVLYAVSAQIAFGHGLLVAVTYPLGALLLGTLGVLAWRVRRRRLV